MINKKGDIGVKQIIFAVIALLVIAGTLYGGTGAYDKFRFYFGLIDYNASLGVSEVSRVGIDLSNGELKYFTGTKWKEIDEKQTAFILNEFEFNPTGLSGKFKEFYSGKRDPEKLVVDVNHWRKWEAEIIPDSWGEVKVRSNSKNGFDSFSYGNPSKIDSEGAFESSFFHYNIEKNIVDFILLEGWRDQILDGGGCEKFMGFKMDKINGKIKSEKTNNYKVKKRFDYIYVDLNEDVIGESQRWGTANCKEPVSYLDDENRDISDKRTDAVVTFEEDGDTRKFWWSIGHEVWRYQSGDNDWTQVNLDSSDPDYNKVPRRYRETNVNFLGWDKNTGFEDGINYLSEVILSNIVNLKVEIWNYDLLRWENVNLDVLKGKIRSEKSRAFEYVIFDKYYKYTKSLGELKYIGEGKGPYLFEVVERNGVKVGELFFDTVWRDRDTKLYEGLVIKDGEIRYRSYFSLFWDETKVMGESDNWIKEVVGRINENGIVEIIKYPTVGELSGATQEAHGQMINALNEINGKNLRGVVSGEIPQNFYGAST